MCHGNQFILSSKGQAHESQKQCRRVSWHSCDCWLLVNTERLRDKLMQVSFKPVSWDDMQRNVTFSTGLTRLRYSTVDSVIHRLRACSRAFVRVRFETDDLWPVSWSSLCSAAYVAAVCLYVSSGPPVLCVRYT